MDIDTPQAGDPLVDALRARLGDDAVLAGAAGAEPFATDILRSGRARPRAVVRPRDTAGVADAVRLARAHGAAVVPFGGNTGFCRGALADGSGTQLVVSLARMNRVLGVDRLNGTMTVQAGCVLADLQREAERHDRVLALSHGGEGGAQIGGCLSTNAGGNNVLRFGMAREQVLGLEVVLPDGRVLDALRGLRKDNAGYDLKHWFLGTEGTLGIVTAAVLALRPRPRLRETALVAVPSPAAAVELLAHLRGEVGEAVVAFELLPRLGLELFFETAGAADEPFAVPHAWQVLVELEAHSRHFRLRDALEEALASAIDRGLAQDAVLAESGEHRRRLWRLREGIAVAAVSDPSSLKNDQSVPCSSIPRFVDEARDAVLAVVPGARVVPFGHVGDGNIHFNVWRPPALSPEAFVAQWKPLTAALEAVATRLGGSIAAEHGIGEAKRAALARARDPVAIDLMRRVKAAIDPDGAMNPGKVVP